MFWYSYNEFDFGKMGMMALHFPSLYLIMLTILLFRPYRVHKLQRTSNRAMTFFKTSKCCTKLSFDHVYPWVVDKRAVEDGLARRMWWSFLIDTESFHYESKKDIKVLS